MTFVMICSHNSNLLGSTVSVTTHLFTHSIRIYIWYTPYPSDPKPNTCVIQRWQPPECSAEPTVEPGIGEQEALFRRAPVILFPTLSDSERRTRYGTGWELMRTRWETKWGLWRGTRKERAVRVRKLNTAFISQLSKSSDSKKRARGGRNQRGGRVGESWRNSSRANLLISCSIVSTVELLVRDRIIVCRSLYNLFYLTVPNSSLQKVEKYIHN